MGEWIRKFKLLYSLRIFQLGIYGRHQTLNPNTPHKRPCILGPKHGGWRRCLRCTRSAFLVVAVTDADTYVSGKFGGAGSTSPNPEALGPEPYWILNQD